MPGMPQELIQLFAMMGGGDPNAGIVQPKTKRDFVSENSPRKEPAGDGMNILMDLFANMSEGESRRISVEGGAGGDATTGVYPWPELAPSMGQVPSVMPQAEAMGGLNEQLIRDYTDAMNVYNEGGKGEKIASIIAGLAGTGGYIADRTSGDIDRRRQSGPDLDYALQNLFATPQIMRGKRQGQMESAMSSADMRHKLRTGTVKGVSGALTEDDRKSLAWHQLAQQSDLGRRRVAALGSQKPELLRDKQWKKANDLYERDYMSKVGQPGGYATEDDAFEAFEKKWGFQAKKLEDIWKYKHIPPGETYTDWDAEADKAWFQLYGEEWKNSEGDDEKRQKLLNQKNLFKQKFITDRLRLHGESANPEDILPPMAGPGDEITEGGDERSFWDKSLGGLGGLFGVGTEEGGFRGAIEGFQGAPDEDMAGALESITNTGGNVEQVEGGFIVTNPDGSTSFIPSKKAPEQERRSPVGMDLSNMMKYISSLGK